MNKNNKKRTTPLTFINWNANSINMKLHELRDFVYQHDPDIMIITETHLDGNKKLKISGYNTYRSDRDYRGGGVAILCKNNLQSSEEKRKNTGGYESISVLFRINDKDMRVVGIYNSPKNNLKDTDIDYYFSDNKQTIYAGDLNSKHTVWGCNSSNRNGITLKKIINDKNLTVVAPLEPTYYPVMHNMKPDILDFTITNIKLPMYSTVIHELTSDHRPVITNIGIYTEKTPNTTTKINWDLYHNILVKDDIATTNHNNTNEVEKDIEKITKNMQNAIDKATTTKKYSNTFMKLPREIKVIIKERNKLRKNYQRTLDPGIKNRVKEMNANIKKKCSIYKKKQWEEKIENLSVENNSVWKLAKALKTEPYNYKTLKTKSGFATSNKDKSEAFADAMEDQFSLNKQYDKTTDKQVKSDIEDYMKSSNKSSFIEPTNLEEISEIIKKLKNHKAPGSDNVKNKMIKNLPENYQISLVNIYNSCLRMNFFPNKWKLATIVLFPKPGKDLTIPENYRPISLLSTLGKILEKIILNRMSPSLSILPNEQYGFRRNLDTTKQLLRINEFIGRAAHNKESTTILMIDISKAFDRVWQAGIIHKMIKLDFEQGIINIVHSYLQNRKFQIRINNETMSTTRKINAGVPQGSILGPVLFTIYTHDFPIERDNHNTITALYADDTSILVKSKDPNLALQRIQEQIYDIEEWCLEWKMAVNPQKSNIIIINNKKRKKKVKPYNQPVMFNTPIPIVKKATYLGVIINEKYTWNDHINYVKGKAMAAANKLKPMLYSKNMDIKLKRLLYISMIRPILTYATPAWCNLNKSNINKLNTIQNKLLRKIFDIPWFVRNKSLRNDLNLPTLHDYMRETNEKFFDKALECEEANFNELFNYEILIEDLKIRPIAAHYHR